MSEITVDVTQGVESLTVDVTQTVEEVKIEVVSLSLDDLNKAALKISSDIDNQASIGADNGVYVKPTDITADPLSYYILAKL